MVQARDNPYNLCRQHLHLCGHAMLSTVPAIWLVKVCFPIDVYVLRASRLEHSYIKYKIANTKPVLHITNLRP